MFKPLERRCSRAWTLCVYGHLHSLPLVLFDLFVIRRDVLLWTHGSSFTTIVAISFAYNTLYLIWIRVADRYSSPGNYMHPFMEDIDGLAGGILFVLLGTGVAAGVAWKAWKKAMAPVLGRITIPNLFGLHCWHFEGGGACGCQPPAQADCQLRQEGTTRVSWLA